MPSPPSSHMQSQSIPEPDHPSNLTPRHELVSKILERTGFEAREFQIQAAQAILNGNDVVVHARTGSGKTLIFAAPHFVLENRVSIVISPLILLQQDQRDRMERLRLTAIALNKEVHVEPETWEELAQGKYEIVLLSPEMALHSEDVHKVFDSDAFRKALIAIHVDEAHTISLWGGDFRKDYQGLGRVRARLPKGVPATLVSATLRPNVKHDAMSTLGFSSDSSKYVDINIGNERTNVFIGARPMNHPASSFRDLFSFFDPEETGPSKIPPTIIYIDNVNNVTLAVIALYSWLHSSLRGQKLIMPVHAWMTPKYRSEAMARFASGEVRVIIATEAAGMGCDISNIERVIQFGVCGSIDAFMQRIGRAWRGPDGKGEGWLIYEKWVPSCNRDRAPSDKGKASANKKRKAPGNDGETQAPSDANKSEPMAKTERKCDRLVQGLVTESVCRRKYLNRVYDNPQSKTVVPPQDCCDLCDPNSATRLTPRAFPIQRGPPRAARVSGESNPDMLSCLRAWRAATFPSAFGISRMFGASALISDIELERISRCAPVPSIDCLRSYLIKWSHVDSQLESMWEALKAGGFALPIPIEPSETAAATAAPIPRSQPTPGPSNVQTPSAMSKPQRPAGKAPKTQPKALKPRNSTQTPVLDTWWRGHSGERNYEVRHTNMDDLRRISTGQAGGQTHEESIQYTCPSKRPRSDNMDNPHGAPPESPPAPHTATTLLPTPRIANSTFHAPARPVGRLIVPSQRLRPPPIRPDPPFTAAGLTRLCCAEAVAPLRHPLPLIADDFTYFGIPRIHALLPRTTPLYRPPNPQPPPWCLSLDHSRAINELRAFLNPLPVRPRSLRS